MTKKKSTKLGEPRPKVPKKPPKQIVWDWNIVESEFDYDSLDESEIQQ
jgi:hypothetical protein